ncbi:MAG: sugar transferase [Phycisphaerae bacterium]|nr:sugar transferase [Phycisphaerae bacterium]
MQLIVMHNGPVRGGKTSPGLLRSILEIEPLADIVWEELARCGGFDARKVILIPEEWRAQPSCEGIEVMHYASGRLAGGALARVRSRSRWCIISNGRFVASIPRHHIERLLDKEKGLIALRVDPASNAYREKVCLGSSGHLAGFKRVYANAPYPDFMGPDWPHHLLVRMSMLDKLLIDGALPLDFGDLLNVCSLRSLECRCHSIGGSVLDMETESGILRLFAARRHLLRRIPSASLSRVQCHISPSARFYGDVLVTDDVHVDDDAVVVGPAILGGKASIGRRAVVKASIVAPNVLIPDGTVIRNRVLVAPRPGQVQSPRQYPLPPVEGETTAAGESGYRTWPLLSYARCTKRIADVIFSAVVLLLFAPAFPVIAAIIKMNSAGPVFFKHKRQGLHGRAFNCLKFRTMIVRAEVMQEKLRSMNHVDGPQFKMADDPRVTSVGKFLRDTFIDEIPQFINVLLGEMSVVGPRPSPEAENLLCPFWRDARLSVRPGVTGLWQVCRTRRLGQDFQEWIHYDTQYVRNMSLRQDLGICLKTVGKLIANFAHHIR